MPALQSKFWCFTINNPISLLDPEEFADAGHALRYMIYSEEIGDTGTNHFQGYMEFNERVTLSFIKTVMDTAHLEVRRGGQVQAADYCAKGPTHVDGPYIYGTMVTQGRRSDLLEVKELMDAGATADSIADSHFVAWVHNNRSLEKYGRLKSSKRNFKTECFVLWGPTNLGKSTWVETHCNELGVGLYWKSNDSKWWDDYNGTDDVIFDDFYGWVMFSTMLRLMDKFPCTVETKGGTVNFAPKRIYFTTNDEPRDFWREEVVTPAKWESFARRVEHWMYFPGPDKGVYVEKSSYLAPIYRLLPPIVAHIE